jgi:hypothetical protein
VTTECHWAKNLDPRPPEYEAEMLIMPFGVKNWHCRTKHEIAVSDRTDRGLLEVNIPILAGTDSKKPQKTAWKGQCTWKDANWLPQEYKLLYRTAHRYCTDSKQPTTICRVYQWHHWILNSHRDTDEIPTSGNLTDISIKRKQRFCIVTGDKHF